MDLTAESAAGRYPGPPAYTDTRLQGYQLLLARAIWLTVAAVSVAIFVPSIPPYYVGVLALADPHIETP